MSLINDSTNKLEVVTKAGYLPDKETYGLFRKMQLVSFKSTLATVPVEDEERLIKRELIF